MANAYDPFGLGKRKPEDPKLGPAVPNMGGIPQTPLHPQANLNPFAIPPVAGDKGGRPTEGAVAPNPLMAAPPATPIATASGAQPPIDQTGGPGVPPQEAQHDRNAHQQGGITINVGGEKPRDQTVAAEGQGGGGPVAPTASGSFGASASGPVAGLPPPVKLDRMPTAPEMNFAPPGAVIETPNGHMTRGPDGNWQFQPNEVGIAKYKQAKVRAIQQFGHRGPLHDDPNAPLPPVEPGQPWFNPFTGQWGGEQK